MEVLGLAHIALGLTIGIVMGWSISRAFAVTASRGAEEELIRTKAMLELGDKSNENVREQMLDGFRLAAEKLSHRLLKKLIRRKSLRSRKLLMHYQNQWICISRPFRVLRRKISRGRLLSERR